MKVGREEEARYILGRLRGETGEDVGKAEAEFQDIRNIAELERKTAKTQSYFSMLFGIGSGKLHTGRRVQLVIWLQIMQEWIGIAGVTIFAPTIFRTAGIPNAQVQWISGLNTITYMVSSARVREVLRILIISRWPPSFVFLPLIELVAAGLCTGAQSSKVSLCSLLAVCRLLVFNTRLALLWLEATLPVLLL